MRYANRRILYFTLLFLYRWFPKNRWRKKTKGALTNLGHLEIGRYSGGT